MSKVKDDLKSKDVDYETTLNNLDIGFYKGEVQGKILSHNSAFNKIFGYDPSENLVGSEARQFFIYPDEMKKYYDELIEKDFARNLIVHVKDINGDIKVVQLNSRLIRNEMGEPIEVEGTFVDITETHETSQKLKELKDLYRLITECAKSVIFTQDMNLKFTYMSPEIYDLLGYTSDQMLSDTITKYNTPDSLKIVANALKEEFKIEKMNIKPLNRVRRLEVQQIHKDGHIIDVEIVCTFLRDEEGKPTGIFGVSRDITARKETERKLKESKHNLSERFKELTCLYGISQLVENPDISIEDLIQGSLDLFPLGWQFPEITAVKIKYDNKVFQTDNFMETKWKITTKQVIHEKILEIEVCYLEDKPFLEEELLLINDIGKRLKVIIDQREAEQKLKKSEEKYKNLNRELETILDIIPGMLFSKDKNDIVTRVNQSFVDFLKLNKEDIIGKTTFDLFPREQAEKFRQDDLDVIYSGEPKINIEESVDSPEGQIFSLTNKVPYLNERGEVSGIIGLALDITERKNVEKKLKQSEEKWRAITKYSPDHILVMDKDHNIEFINYTVPDLTIEEVIGKPIYDFVPEEYKDIHRKSYNKVFNTGKPTQFETVYIDKYGIQHFFEVNTGPILAEGKVTELINRSTDITERKKAEIRLRESEEKFRTITEQSLVGIAILQDNEVKYANEKILDLTGYTIDEIKDWGPQGFSHVIHPDDRSFVMEQMVKKQDGKNDVVNRYEIRVIKKNGDILWVDNYSKTITFEGRPADLAILVDITKQKELINICEESEEKYHTIFKASPVGIGISDIDGNILDSNIKLQNILGYTAEELQNVNARSTYVDVHERQEILNILKKSGIVNNYEVKLKKKDDTVFSSSLNIETLEMGKNRVFLSIIEDITERKKIEKNLTETNKFLSTILDNTPILIAYLDSKFNFIRVNRVYAEADEHEVSFYPGKNHFDLFPHEENKEIFQRVVDTVEPYHILAKPFEYAEYPERGISYWDWSLIPIKAPNGDVRTLILSLQNVTEQVKSQKQIIDIAKFPSENPNPVLRVDTDNILYINEVGRRLFNITEGNKIPYILKDAIDSIIAKNYSKDLEIGLNDRIYSFDVTPIQDEGYINIYGRDITEQKISEEALKTVKEFTDNVLDTSIDTIFVFEPETGRAIRWNEAFRITSGYTDDEIASLKAPDSYYSEEDLIKAAEAAEEALSTGVTTVEMSLLTKDGHSIPFEYTGRTFKSLDGDLLIVAVGRDITERKKVEAVLKESEKRYRDAYNRASFYKELIAHDMNNILQSIHSSVELYKLSKEKPELFKDKKDFLSSITENVFRGSQIASNVIKLSELEELSMPLGLVDVNKNLMDAIVFIHKIYQTRKLNINVETFKEDHFALANDLILDLFENILLNSIKHNFNPEIEIQTRISDIQLDNRKYCKIEFIDNGVGIPDERKEVIFQRREKNGISTRGMGIGLSLVKQIVDSYNGKIWVENKVKEDHTKGSKFIVLIPKTK